MRLAVFGDSFATDDGDKSWTRLLSKEFYVDNFAQRGISEYRIYKIIKRINLDSYDRVIVFHTNPDRVFVPDHVQHPSRDLSSHPFCDMVANDSLTKQSWSDIVKCYYKHFYDQDFQMDLFNLLSEKIFDLSPKILHYSGFDLPDSCIQSFYHVRQSNPGNINHLDEQGNFKVYQSIKGSLL